MDIIFASKEDAKKVIECATDVCARFGSLTVSDVKDLVGLPTTHTDAKKGWAVPEFNLVERIDGMWWLVIPNEQPV